MNLAMFRFLGWLQSVAAKARDQENGQGLVEYALIIALIAVVVIVALVALRTQISNIFNHVSTCLSNASGCAS